MLYLSQLSLHWQPDYRQLSNKLSLPLIEVGGLDLPCTQVYTSAMAPPQLV